MKLSSITENIRTRTFIAEGIKSDFFDMYLLLSSPHALDSDDGKMLFHDRVDSLMDAMRLRLYRALVDRPFQLSVIEREELDELVKITDPRQCKDTVDNLIQRDIDAGDYGGSYNDAWEDLIEVFYKFTNPPRDDHEKAAMLDRFFAMSHNGGSIIDYLNLPWLFDALYLKNLAHPNELATHASPDAYSAARSAINGSGFKPVTANQKRALYNAKKKRWPNRRLTPYDNIPSWVYDHEGD